MWEATESYYDTIYYDMFLLKAMDLPFKGTFNRF